MKKAVVVGAGFSGLTLAYYLAKLDIEVELFELTDEIGGLIGTEFTEWGHIESAANALLCDENVEDLFRELNLPFAETGPEAGRRLVYWDEPRAWPLSIKTSFKLLTPAMRRVFGGVKFIEPHSGESVADWCRRHVNDEFLERLVGPALQGIFAGDPENLSARLVELSLFHRRTKKGERRGSVAPEGGMGSLISALKDQLLKMGTTFKLKSNFQVSGNLPIPHIVATSGWRTADVIEKYDPASAEILRNLDPLPLVRATLFFEKHASDIQAFGCLFPRAQEFFSLGVLFNDSLFPNSAKCRSESYILGGALNRSVVAASDEAILAEILRDRERLTKRKDQPLYYKLHRWPRAIPNYSVAWESHLKSLRVEPPLYLHGNYLGRIGLSRILARSKRLARRINERYG